MGTSTVEVPCAYFVLHRSSRPPAASPEGLCVDAQAGSFTSRCSRSSPCSASLRSPPRSRPSAGGNWSRKGACGTRPTQAPISARRTAAVRTATDAGLTSGMCMWEENSALADQCTPGEGVGRWKTYGGCFWEPGVIAQNQCEPTSGSSGGSNGTWQLLSGGTLGSGGYLESPSRRYRFTNTQNGALELSEHGYVIWSRGPFGTGSLSMQNTDGNLIFVVNGVHVWASNTPAGRMPPPIPLRIRLIPEERPVHLRKRRIS